MILAKINNKRVIASPKKIAICPLCNQEVISKCGKIKIWHWAHKFNQECDSFKEPESKWHLNWKNNWKEKNQEVIIKKGDNYHIADIKTKTGLIIELQHSNISREEIEKRENFYENMIWILDGETFGKNIILKNKIIKWNWAPSILKFSKKQIFIDFKGNIIKINRYWKFKNRTYCSFLIYSKKDFLKLYGDIYDDK